jgi:hypothetical protein
MAKLYFYFVALAGLAAPTHSTPHRSQGYAGSTPVGLDGYVAFAKFDCAKINADPRRDRVRVPLSYDCSVSVPSPDRRLLLQAIANKAQDYITLRATSGLLVRNLEQPATILWNPRSTGFLINDGEGSGQVSRLRYFYLERGVWRESRALHRVASALYRRRYDCRRSKNSYTNVSGWNWTKNGLLRAVVQEGVHSEGCIQPHDDWNVLLEIIGNPVTGRILSAREVRKLP